MQNAKKLLLVDPDFEAEYRHLRRPAADVAKTKSSIDIKKILDDTSLDDDVKVRKYVNTLHRIVNIGKKPVPETVKINWLTEPQYQLQLQHPPAPIFAFKARDSSEEEPQTVVKKTPVKRKLKSAKHHKTSRIQWDQRA